VILFALQSDLWCADFKGEFMLADKRHCYPLTITDFASRYLLCCDALAMAKEKFAFTVFERAFKDFGLPLAIRVNTNNGVPFASTSAFFGLSKLSIWRLRLGIGIRAHRTRQCRTVFRFDRQPRSIPALFAGPALGSTSNGIAQLFRQYIGRRSSLRARRRTQSARKNGAEISARCHVAHNSNPLVQSDQERIV
jgi:hypothetical protein